MQVRPFQLSLGVDDEGTYLLYVYTDVHNIALPIDIPDRILAVGTQLLEARQPVFYDDPHELGSELGAILYPPEVQQQLHAAADRALRTKERVQIHLQIAVPELAALPWEWAIIPTPQPWAPARTDDFPVIRLSSVAQPAPPIVIDGPLRILLCVHEHDFDTVNTIYGILSHEIAAQRIAVDVRTILSAVDIEVALQQHEYHIVHCMAAVQIDADHQVTLRYAEAIPSDTLRTLFAPYPQIGLLLITPVGYPTAELLAFPQLYAAMLLSSTLPAAITSSGTLTPAVAVRAAATLYNALREGTALDLAVSRVRRTLSHFEVDTVWGFLQLRMVAGSEHHFVFPPPAPRSAWVRAALSLIALLLTLFVAIVLGRWLRGDTIPPFLRAFLP